MKIDAINITNVYDSKKSYATKMAIEAEKFDVPEIQNDEFKKSDNLTDVSKISSPAFMGKKGFAWGGTIGSAFGTLAGIGAGAILTAITGGLAAPLIATAVGCAAGGIAGSKIGDSLEGSDPPSNDPREDDDGYNKPTDFYSY